MAGITAVPKQERTPIRENTWTLTKACKVGETYPLAGHDVKVVRILEERTNSNLCEVEVLGGSYANVNSLRFTGEFGR